MRCSKCGRPVRDFTIGLFWLCVAALWFSLTSGAWFAKTAFIGITGLVLLSCLLNFISPISTKCESCYELDERERSRIERASRASNTSNEEDAWKKYELASSTAQLRRHSANRRTWHPSFCGCRDCEERERNS